MQPQTIDLNKTLKGLEQLMRPLMGADVEFRAILSPEPALVRADPTQIDQVIMNFVVNACDAMPAGGELTIEIATTELDSDVIAKMHADVAPGPFAVLAVSDTGIGMDEATAQHIFEPFFTTKETGKGAGLGLATVHGIIRQSGGTIWVTSEAKVGTTFTVYLPRVMGDDAEVEMAKSVDGGNATILAGTSETILLVEDDRTLRVLIRQVLNTAGYRVLESRDVEEALELCERHEGVIALMVTDVVMPVMSGPQLAERVVKMRPELKVLFSSGYPGAELEEQGLRPEEIHFFEKPFTPDALLRKVREVLDSPAPTSNRCDRSRRPSSQTSRAPSR